MIINQYENLETESKLWDQIKFHNLNALYEKLKPFILGGFEDKPDDKSDYDMFMDINMEKQNCIAYLSKQAVEDDGCAIVPCCITQGSLATIEIDLESLTMDNNIVYIGTYISLGNLVIGTNTKISEFSQAVVENNEGFEYGDQISCIFGDMTMNQADKIPHSRIFGGEATLDQNNYNLLNDPNSTDYFTYFKTLNGKLALAYDFSRVPINLIYVSVSWIHSRKDENDKLLVSTQEMMESQFFNQESDRLYALPTYGFDNNPPFIEPGDLETAVVPDGAPAVVEMKTLDTRDLSGYITDTVTSWTSSDTSVATVSNGVVSSLDYTYTGSTECPFKYADITVVTSNNDTYKFKIKVIPRNVVLTDGNAYLCNESFVAESISYTRTFTSTNVGKWQALYLPFSFNVEDYKTNDFDIAEIYYIGPNRDTNEDGVVDTNDESNTVLNILSIGLTKVNTPYMIRVKAATTYTIVSQNTTLATAKINKIDIETSREKWYIRGIYEDNFYAVPGDNNIYITASGGYGYASTKNVKIKPNRFIIHKDIKEYIGIPL